MLFLWRGPAASFFSSSSERETKIDPYRHVQGEFFSLAPVESVTREACLQSPPLPPPLLLLLLLTFFYSPLRASTAPEGLGPSSQNSPSASPLVSSRDLKRKRKLPSVLLLLLQWLLLASFSLKLLRGFRTVALPFLFRPSVVLLLASSFSSLAKDTQFPEWTKRHFSSSVSLSSSCVVTRFFQTA